MLLVSEPILGADEKEALSDVIDSGWLTMGDRVRDFEEAFATMHGAEDAVAVSSCTAALHLILQALGFGRGDEVLVPILTFVATANGVRYVGSHPRSSLISSSWMCRLCPWPRRRRGAPHARKPSFWFILPAICPSRRMAVLRATERPATH